MTDSTLSDLPNVDKSLFHIPAVNTVFAAKASTHPPRILLLYGSLRERSFSRLVVQESARILQAFGAETRIFNPTGLPLPMVGRPGVVFPGTAWRHDRHHEGTD